MKIEDILDLWKSDSEIDITNLSVESLNTPKIHHKYLKILYDEKLTLEQLKTYYKSYYRDRHDLFSGSIDEETCKRYGWKPNPKLILRGDIQMHIEAEPETIKMTLRIAQQKEKIEVLESIMKMISNRGFQIKSSIDVLRFEAGL